MVKDPVTNLETVRRGVGVFIEPVEVLTVSGGDALTYLQGQMSQDVTSLAEGEAAWSMLLEPQGKLVALVRLWRRGDGVLIEVDKGAGERVRERLQRFLLRVDVALEVGEWHRVLLRGEGTPDAAALRSAAPDATVLVTDAIWPGVRGVDAIGADRAALETLVPEDAIGLDSEAAAALRIEAGWPAHGAEFEVEGEPSLIPAEAGSWLVEAAASFTKGCYTGQELVARVDSRGSNTPRKLRGLVFDADAPVPPGGASLLVDDTERGVLTSVAGFSSAGPPVGLAFVHRSVVPPAAALLRWDEPGAGTHEVPVTVAELPLVPDEPDGNG